jgi:hypothetical protein
VGPLDGRVGEVVGDRLPEQLTFLLLDLDDLLHRLHRFWLHPGDNNV